MTPLFNYLSYSSGVKKFRVQVTKRSLRWTCTNTMCMESSNVYGKYRTLLTCGLCQHATGSLHFERCTPFGAAPFSIWNKWCIHNLGRQTISYGKRDKENAVPYTNGFPLIGKAVDVQMNVEELWLPLMPTNHGTKWFHMASISGDQNNGTTAHASSKTD